MTTYVGLARRSNQTFRLIRVPVNNRAFDGIITPLSMITLPPRFGACDCCNEDGKKKADKLRSDPRSLT
jgi:hypothetical protein